MTSEIKGYTVSAINSGVFVGAILRAASITRLYPHLVPDSDAVADWTSATTLLPYLERLPEEMHDSFMASYRAKLRAIWPAGPVLFTFRRILIAATN